MVINDAREFGRAVADWRGSDVSQQELAQALGVSRTLIALLEQGRRLPNPDVLDQIRRHCGFTALRWGPRDGDDVIVHVCCLTYYLPWAKADLTSETRHRFRLVVNVKNVETYTASDGKRHVAAEFATKKALSWPGRAWLRASTFVPVPRSNLDARENWPTYAHENWPARRTQLGTGLAASGGRRKAHVPRYAGLQCWGT